MTTEPDEYEDTYNQQSTTPVPWVPPPPRPVSTPWTPSPTAATQWTTPMPWPQNNNWNNYGVSSNWNAGNYPNNWNGANTQGWVANRGNMQQQQVWPTNNNGWNNYVPTTQSWGPNAGWNNNNQQWNNNYNGYNNAYNNYNAYTNNNMNNGQQITQMRRRRIRPPFQGTR